MGSPRVRIFLIGDASRSEFGEACRTLDTMGLVTRLPDIASAVAATDGRSTPPDVVVLAQAYPGQFQPDAIDQLRCRVPLARFVALLGSWCEGETRTGRPSPGVIRLYWHQGPARCRQELLRLADGRGSTWGLPVTAAEEERLLAAAEAPMPERRGLIAVLTCRAEMEGWLSAACIGSGYATVWLHPRHAAVVRGATAAIYDGGEMNAAACEDIRRLAALVAPAPVLALLDSPRIDDHRLARAAGAAAVLAKPLHVNDLLWQLGELDSEGSRSLS